MALSIMLTAAIACVVMIIVIWIVVMWLTRPITKVQDSLVKISNLDLSISPDLDKLDKRSDEVGRRFRNMFTAELGEAVIGTDEEIVAAYVVIVVIRWTM